MVLNAAHTLVEVHCIESVASMQEGQVTVCAGREAEDGEHGARAEDVRGRAAADDGHEAVARHAHLHRRAGQGRDRATPVPRVPPGRAGAPQLPGTGSLSCMEWKSDD